MVYRSYKDWELKDFKDYYLENYKGKGRVEVLKEDCGFYQVVVRRKLLDEVFPEQRRYKGKGKFSYFSLKDFKKYYQENHKEKGRAEVSKEDSGFYTALYNRGLINNILPEDKRWKYLNWTLKDFKNYYKENHKGKMRGEVSKEDPSFYYVTSRRKFLDKVFSVAKYERKSEFSNFSVKDFKNYYKENYDGLFRTEVRRKGFAFFCAVNKRNLLDEVFSEKRTGIRGKFSNFSVKDFKNYYKENYYGMSKGEISQKEQGFYIALRKRNLLDKLITNKNILIFLKREGLLNKVFPKD